MVETCADDNPLGRAVLDGHHPSAVTLHHALALFVDDGEEIYFGPHTSTCMCVCVRMCEEYRDQNWLEARRVASLPKP